jgi:ribA/ribD-fused uncharacterized protein
MDIIQPIFIKDKDYKDINIPISDYAICKATARIVGESLVEGVQKVRGLWSMYVKSIDSRVNLLLKGSITVNGQAIQVYDENPFINQKGPISPILPRNTKIAGYHCNLYHDGQFKSHCKLCKVPGHSQGDENCPSKLEEGQHIIPFSSENNVFSKFYPCKISAFGERFESSESCYQWYKAREAGRPDLAEDLKNAKHADEAKRLSYNIPKAALESWKTKEVEVMKNIIELKAEQVAEFRDALIGSNDEYLVEATRKKMGGSGISSELTRASNPCTWPLFEHTWLVTDGGS